ncbi:endonuclease V family protein [Forsythia ovata]|uniref:Endonuclease V family protein n=1 Tax=Forsythia ovata TaxID=205694 RepID=A0ABD1W6S5_9LAMI
MGVVNPNASEVMNESIGTRVPSNAQAPSGQTFALFRIQDSLKKRLKIEDDFSWKIPTSEVQNLEINTENSDSRAILKYVGGAPVLLDLLEKMKKGSLPFYPQILMVDGNGLLHPRGFGLACHLGVLANVPTVGIGKNLHHVDGLNQSRVRQLLEAEGNLSKDVF